MNEILTIIVPSIVTAVIGYFVGFRKNNIDLCGARLDELEKSLVVYNNIIGDMSQKISDLRLEIKSLETSVEKLLEENKNLRNTRTK
jgi:uncharacterized coiled-coil protein SlyX